MWKLDESENVKEEPKPKQLSNFAPLCRSVAARQIVDEVAKWGTTTRNRRKIGPGEKFFLDKYVTNIVNNAFYFQL